MAHERKEAANPNDEDHLFLTEDRYPITANVVAKILERVKKAAGVPCLHPHICRHTFSVRFLVNGGDVFSLQKILGHASLEMTCKYVNSVSILPNNRVIFNINGNNYRLVVIIEYSQGKMFIRFVGTHADYDRIDAATI